MTLHLDYCRDKGAPAGSNFYYSLLFENDESKTKLISLYALHNEFIDCLSVSHDPGVTRLKFNWWHEELSRLSENIPRHPVTQSINALSISNPDLLSILHEHLVLIESLITTAHSENYQDWLQFFISKFGKYWLALNELDNEHPNAESLSTNGGLIFSVELISIYPLYADKTPGFLPADLCKKHSNKNNETLYAEIFGELLPYFHDNLEIEYKTLKKANQKPALFNLILNRITKMVCHEIILDGNRIMKHRVQLTPIRKLWLSYLTRLTY